MSIESVILRPRAKEKPQQDGRRGEIVIKIKPHTQQRRSEGSHMPCAHQDPETPQRLDCVWASPAEVRVSSGPPQGLWLQQTWVWHRPSWRRSPVTPPQSRQNLVRTGEPDSWRHRQNLVCTRTREKGAVPPQETDPDLPGNVQESPAEAWVSAGVGLLQGRGAECSRACRGPSEGGHHSLHCLHRSLASGQIQGGNTALQ